MRIVKAFWLFLLLTAMGACFNPPEFPVIPEIEYENIQFFVSGTGTDSLVLTFTFHDGDGDLGIDEDDPFYLSYPFHDVSILQERPDAKVDTLPTNILPWTEPGLIANREKVPKTGSYNLIDIKEPVSGRLATIRSRQKPQFNYLPAASCKYYSFMPLEQRMIIRKSARNAVEKRSIIDSLSQPGPGNQRTVMYYVLQDTFLTKFNPYHYDIEVQFLVKDNNGFSEFDWRTELCNGFSPGQSFDGRFPILTQTPGTALDGRLKYRMNSSGFLPLFSVKTLKLRFRIRDRALHNSRWAETPEFTLDKIRVR